MTPKSIFISFLLLLWSQGIAQQTLIKGSLKDIQGKPIQFADVLLLHMPDSAQVATVLTDDIGNYTIADVEKGSYVLLAHVADLNETQTKTIEIDGGSPILEHEMVMDVSMTEVETVVITSKKSLVKQEAGKMVVSVEGSMSSAGLTGIDVLRRMPGISVDRNGKVSLKGRAGVQVMLDDKPLYMSEEQLSDLLKSLPSDLIKEIEVITSPSAKYDAVGSAGIVNIKLKEGAYEGLNGNVSISLGMGIYHKANAGTTISYKKKKYSLDFGYQYNDAKHLDDAGAYRATLDPAAGFHKIGTMAYYKNLRHNHSMFLKGKYQLYKSGSLGYNVNSVIRNVDVWGNSNSYRQNGEDVTIERYDSDYREISSSANINGGLDFTHVFDTLGTQISTAVAYNGENGKSDRRTEALSFDTINTTPSHYLQYANATGQEHQWSAKADFATTFAQKRVKLEFGLKTNQYYRWQPNSFKVEQQGTTKDSTSDFRFNENIYAGYFMLSAKLKKWKLEGGLRVENTRTEGHIFANDTTFKRNYTNLFPSFTASYQASEKTSYSLMYSKRIQRPSADQLSAQIFMVDKYTYWAGSPYLLPEYAHNLEFAYSKFGGILITTLNYSYMVNTLNFVILADPQTLNTVMGDRNLKYSTNTGIAVSLNIPINKWWQSNNFVNLYHNELVGDMGYGAVRAKANSWKMNSTQTFKLPKGFSIEVSGTYDAKGAYSLGTYKAFGQLNMAVQKSVLKNKGSIKLAYSDIFWTHKYQNTATYNNVYSVGSYRWDNSVIMATFSYKFGKRLER